MHPMIALEDTQLPLERSPKILGVIMDPSLSFHKQDTRQEKQYAKGAGGLVLGTGQGDVTADIQRTGESIASYAAPIWSTNVSDSSFMKIQTVQNAALKTVTGADKMASIDHLHHEPLTLKVRHHSDMLSAHCLVNCLEEDHVSHFITTLEPKHIPMKETIHSRHHSTVLTRLGASRKKNLQNLYTHELDSVIQLS